MFTFNPHVWCLLAQDGTVVERGKVPTTAVELTALVQRLLAREELLVGQEVGKLCQFVHDTLTAAGAKVLSFNAHQLRIIASIRKKTDKRDAYWIAKSLQTGMMPHPVYIPTGEVRTLRALISRRDALVTEHKRWLSRARWYLQAAGSFRSLGSRMEGWRPLASGVLPTPTATDVSSKLPGAQLEHQRHQLRQDSRRSGPPQRQCESAP